MIIEYKDIKPRFGQVVTRSDGSNVIRIDNSLSKSIQNFILKHELYHFKRLDKKGLKLYSEFKHIWWEEILANLHGTLYYPIGAFRCVLKSFAWYRIKFYINRFKKGE